MYMCLCTCGDVCVYILVCSAMEDRRGHLESQVLVRHLTLMLRMELRALKGWPSPSATPEDGFWLCTLLLSSTVIVCQDGQGPVLKTPYSDISGFCLLKVCLFETGSISVALAGLELLNHSNSVALFFKKQAQSWMSKFSFLLTCLKGRWEKTRKLTFNTEIVSAFRLSCRHLLGT